MIIETKNGNHNMSREEFIRWLCLLEIVDKTEEKARELKVDLDKIDWVKPVAFKKYIKDRFKSMEIDLVAEEGGIGRNLDYNSLSNIPRIQEYHSQTYQTQTSLIHNQDLEDMIHHV
jgi:hypothetical protein